MPELVLFDEWHLQWRLDPTIPVDAASLHAQLNAPESLQAVQDCLQTLLQQQPHLHPLHIQLDR